MHFKSWLMKASTQPGLARPLDGLISSLRYRYVCLGSKLLKRTAFTKKMVFETTSNLFILRSPKMFRMEHLVWPNSSPTAQAFLTRVSSEAWKPVLVEAVRATSSA
ncbi:hypothetical protein E2C01_011532 [Portunus trituberculatus]|uniref:Uncharacterized protein n=1 Tax=Portunus trituberculatus TaxID=210409 RepID=A0A5B7DBG0_PORTR|nr:hypothetical protein [Portunus trituberculatus]